MIEKLYEHRTTGIYCQTLDRSLLVDDRDFWITLETAKVLSSKVATTVYVFPPPYEMTNENCHLYSIWDKTAEKRDSSPDVILSQMPTLRLFREHNRIYQADFPEDFLSPAGGGFIFRLKAFANYCHTVLTAVEISSALTSHKSFMQFSRTYLPDDMTMDLSAFNAGAKAEIDFRTEVKRILYHANDKLEASANINRAIFGKGFAKDRAMIDTFYEMSRDRL